MSIKPKYVVMHYDTQERLDDDSFFVIRESDVFAPAALYGYAHVMQSALELDALPDRRVFTNDERQRLRSLCDDLVALAGLWARTDKRVPD